MDSGIIFIEHADDQVSGDSVPGGRDEGPPTQWTDKPHCGGCDDGPAPLVTDKPHCSDCGER